MGAKLVRSRNAGVTGEVWMFSLGSEAASAGATTWKASSTPSNNTH